MRASAWLGMAVAVLVAPGAQAAERRTEPFGDLKGLSVLVRSGVEGYAGDLAPQLLAGPAWGVTVQLKPTRLLGLEVGYDGAVNEIRTGTRGGSFDGVDLVRNGGHAAVSLGLRSKEIQPYLLGGVSFSRYEVRGDPRFQDDNAGSIPLGAGVRAEFGRLAADARFNYDLLFDQQFALATRPRELLGIDSTGGARYTGTLSLGAAF